MMVVFLTGSRMALLLLAFVVIVVVADTVDAQRTIQRRASKGGMMMKGGKKKGKKSPSPLKPSRSCTNSLARAITDAAPEAIAVVSEECCDSADEGPQSVFVTHAQTSDETTSGLEPFWDNEFHVVNTNSQVYGICVVMTGVDQNSGTGRSLDQVLLDILETAAENPWVAAIVNTDVTQSLDVVNLKRHIFESENLPWIGSYENGYGNIVEESSLSGKDQLPFVGFLSNTEFGKVGAEGTLQLLNGAEVMEPVCFNHRPDLDIVNTRCRAYYESLGAGNWDITDGITCSAASTAQQLYDELGPSTNVILANVDCCVASAGAAQLAREQQGRTVVVGCIDLSDDALAQLAAGTIQFITTPPIALGAYLVTTWTVPPVTQATSYPYNKKAPGLFPSTGTVVKTGIYNVFE
eukprot:CAMPEP_0168732776 /NCGR_PEP_ID=MMETSP0724-20121128/7941_1 /TAXON_ID=265536 /ORGANISM="Amphiprora sp., Strain CCMP467" /LENGTH=407 /DNA_ID=CAMNT_0008779797 /DNA_START=40 /DNA_END=1263 /DNA_ORIENTATION=-